MPGLLLSLSTSDFYITVDDRSPLTSHLSPLTSVCWLAELLLTVRAEISDWAPPQSRPDPAPGPADVRWPDRHQGSALRSTTGEEREREAEGKYEVFDPSQFKWRRQELSHLWQWRYLYAFQFKLEVIRAQSLLGEISLILRRSRLERLGGYHRCIILFWLRSSNLL